MALKVTLTKSSAGASEDQRKTLAGLGLWKFGQKRLLQDTPAIRGMVFKVKHLVTSEVVSQAAPKRKRTKPRAVRLREAARAQRASQA
jgi:large subunit ribosomal protein L30